MDRGRRHAPARATGWRGTWPAGAMAAAAAAAAEGLRAAVPRIAERAGRPVPADPRWRADPRQAGRPRPGPLPGADGPMPLGAVDVISGGAITNAALYALLRMPAVTAAMRIIEPDLLDLPNLNRYASARRSMLGWPKARALRPSETPGHHHHRVGGDVRRHDRAAPGPDRAAAARRRRPHPVPVGRPARGRRAGSASAPAPTTSSWSPRTRPGRPAPAARTPATRTSPGRSRRSRSSRSGLA